MNAIQFRRGLVLVGIKNGLDLGAAVAAAKEAEAWCLEAGTADVDGLTGGAMADERLALAAPPAPIPPSAANPARKAGRKVPRPPRAASSSPRNATPKGFEARVLAAIEAANGKGIARADVVTATKLAPLQVQGAVQGLKTDGKIVSVGWARAAKYFLAGKAPKTESKPNPARAAAPTAAPLVPAAAREPADREDVGGGAALPAHAGGAAVHARGRPSAPTVIVRNARVEEAVLRAIDCGPGDFETIRTRAEFPGNNVRLALEALAADKTIRARGGIWQRQGDEE